MLRFLRIRNLAVIEAVDVEFDRGFNVLTGETGAGKSILVEAVGLLLGGRASADLVRTGTPHAAIEAIFEDASGAELVVRREISSQGRSRSFVDGALATAGALRALADRLVELHGQHEHQALLDPAGHLPLLDDYARLGEPVARVTRAWDSVHTLRDQLERSRMDSRERAARLDLIAFQLGEIERAAPRDGEDEELAATKSILANAERIERLCQESYASLYESEGAVLGALSGIWKRVGELAEIEPQFAPYLEARDGIKSQLEDLAFQLRSYADGVDASPARLQEVEDRLVLLDRLKRKYGPALADVVTTGESLARERDLLTGNGEASDELQRQLEAASATFLTAARELSTMRRASGARLSRELEALLADLAMARTRVEVRFNERELGPDEWSERGIDRAEFFLSPNPGEDLRPLARIVSGGELSRVMLALKTIAATRAGAASGKTLVFDEVDAGIGGRVADVVGARLQDLGREFQVLCITHLPQIASRAGTHFLIQKEVRGTRTTTAVARLEVDARVEEIARMMAGSNISAAARASARDLIAGAQALPHAKAKGKQKAKGESESR